MEEQIEEGKMNKVLKKAKMNSTHLNHIGLVIIVPF